MAKFIAQAYLTKDGKVVQIGQEIELTEEQAKRLGNKIKVSGDSESSQRGEEGPQGSLEEMTSAELDEFALNELEVPKDEYPKSGNKTAKIEAIQTFQVQQATNE